MPLHARIAKVMGSATMNVTEILDGLAQSGLGWEGREPWDPKSRAIVAQTLAEGMKANRFTREGRGHYRVATEHEEEPVSPPVVDPVVAPVVAPVSEQAVPDVSVRRGAAGDRELRKLISKYGTVDVRNLLDELERE